MRVQGRDLEILLALAKMRLLRTSDVAVLFFAARGTAQKRLRKLFDAGLICAIVADLAAENRYALTAAGHAVLVEAMPADDVPVLRRAPRADRRSVRHLELLNEYRIALARGCLRAGVELERFVPEWDLRASDPRAALIPDAVFVLSGGTHRTAFALEIDTGTESPKTVARKLARYDDAALASRSVGGENAPSVLIVTATPTRARTLARTFGRQPHLQPLLGAAPHVLTDGGLTTGLAVLHELAVADSPLAADRFASGLRSVIE